MNKIASFTRLEWLALAILLLGHSIAAYTSYGYHHPDEHYQIVEWTNYFLGLAKSSDHLAWEFSAQIRPWFQPMLHALLLKPFLSLGWYNPFSAILFLRLFYGLMSILSVFSFWDYAKAKFLLRPIYLVWISLIWFFPYLHVRTSSENLSAILVVFAMISLLKKKNFAVSGIWFGMAFLARYQIALGLIGMGITMVLQERKVTRQHLKMAGGFFIPVLIGVVIDRIGYGNWVFTPYRYFKVNLIDGVAASYNPYPWYQYLIWILQLNPVVSIPLFWGCLEFIRRRSTNDQKDRVLIGSFVWTFFILHCLMTNKEYRFLFPLLNLVPFIAVIGLKRFEGFFTNRPALVFYSIVSLVAFAVSTLHGASVQTLGAVYLAHRNFDREHLIISNRDYPTQSPYYTFPEHPFQHVRSAEEIKSLLHDHPKAGVLIDGKLSDPLTQELIAVTEGAGCAMVDAAFPKWLYGKRNQWQFVSRLTFIAFYRCN